jgi:hypothetical protein
MCSCKTTPLQKAERRLVVYGWSKLATSDLKLIDHLISTKLGVSPTSQEDREELYKQAKSV